MLARAASWLESPRIAFRCAVIALLLSAPSLGSGLQTDDHLIVGRLERGLPLFQSFRITPQDFAEGQQFGNFPWWSGPNVRIAFLRPLSELSTRLDMALWGDNALLMHLENGLLYALIAWLAARIFRQLLPARSAGLAALLFVLNDAHGHSVGWIAGRNSLLSLLFVLASILTYLHFRRPGVGRLASPLLLALALASAEAGVTALAYLLAHALLLAQGPLRQRLLSLWPHALVALAWAGIYVMGGYGAHGAAWYRDVGGAPLVTLAEGLMDLPVWLFGQLGISVISATLMVSKLAYVVVSVLLIPIVVLLIPVVRADRTSRFFALGMLLSIVPMFSTIPQDRVTLVASLGGFGLLASAFSTLGECSSRLRRVSLRVLAALHLGLSPLLFLQAVTSMAGIEGASRKLTSALPDHGGGHVVLVHSPLEILTLYAPMIRRRAGGADLASLHQLYAGSADLSVTRVDARTLELRATPGYCNLGIECIFRAKNATVEHEPRRFGPFVRTVSEARDGRPVAVRFVFDEPLESPCHFWLKWDGSKPVPWLPPEVGASVQLPRLAPVRALAR